MEDITLTEKVEELIKKKLTPEVAKQSAQVNRMVEVSTAGAPALTDQRGTEGGQPSYHLGRSPYGYWGIREARRTS